MSFDNNVNAITKYLLKKFPAEQQKAAIFNGSVLNDETLTVIEYALTIFKKMKHCNFLDLSLEQAMIIYIVTNIKCPTMSTWLYKHLVEFVTEGDIH